MRCFMNYLFRKLTKNDLDSLWELISLLKKENCDVSFTELESKDELLKYVDNPSDLTYVAVTTDDIPIVISVVKARRDLSPEKRHAAFLSAATHPDYRGRSIVVNLTNYVLEELKKVGTNVARIYVYSDNQASLNVVKKLGFVQAGIIYRHHLDVKTNTYVDDIIFHKVL